METWGRKLRFRSRLWRGIKYPLLVVSERTLVILAILAVLTVGTVFTVLMMKKEAAQVRQLNSTESMEWTRPV